MGPSATRQRLRVLTVNVHRGYTALRRRFMLHELREAVHAVGSDLVFLQEVSGAASVASTLLRAAALPGAMPPLTVVHYEYLADRLWRDHAYGRNAVVGGFEHGNALLSRWPIQRWRNHDVSLAGSEPRGVLHCELQPDDPAAPALHAVCVHLGLGERRRRHQLRRLLELIEREVPADAPLIVAGDFNDWRSRADAWLRPAGLVEVFRGSGGAHARSFPARWPLLRLDRIYVRRVAAARPLPLPRWPWALLSDHAPLAAEIHL